MKKTKILVLAGLVFTMPVLQQCMGSFALTNKLYDINKGLGGKFVNELVFFVLIPVYGITLHVDGLILNAIEFWTGANPLAMNEGDVKNERFVTAKGTVDVTVAPNTITFANVENGVAVNPVTFTFSTAETAWYMTTAEGTVKYMQFDLTGPQPKTILFDETGRGVAFDMGTRDADLVSRTLNASRFALAN